MWEARRLEQYRTDVLAEQDQLRAQLQLLQQQLQQLQQGGADEAAHTCDNPNCTECRGDGSSTVTTHATYDLRTWSEEDMEAFTEFHAQADFWGCMPVTAGMTEEELFGPPPGGRRLVAAGAVAAAAAAAARGAGMAERRVWSQGNEMDLHQRIRVSGVAFTSCDLRRSIHSSYCARQASQLASILVLPYLLLPRILLGFVLRACYLHAPPASCCFPAVANFIHPRALASIRS